MSGGRRLAGLPPLARPPACASALLRGPPSLGRAAASSLPSAPARPRAGRSPWGSRAVLASSWGGLGVGGAGASGFRGVGLGPFRPPAPPIAAAGVRWRKESERQGPTVGGRGGVGSRASRPVPGRVASRWLGGVKRARRSPPPTGLRRSISPPRLLVSPPPPLWCRLASPGDRGWVASVRPPALSLRERRRAARAREVAGPVPWPRCRPERRGAGPAALSSVSPRPGVARSGRGPRDAAASVGRCERSPSVGSGRWEVAVLSAAPVAEGPLSGVCAPGPAPLPPSRQMGVCRLVFPARPSSLFPPSSPRSPRRRAFVRSGAPRARARPPEPRPQIRRGDPLNLSILVSGGKETNQDSLSNGE